MIRGLVLACCLLLSCALQAAIPQLLVDKDTPFIPIRYASMWRGAQVQFDGAQQRIYIDWYGDPREAMSGGHEWYDVQRGAFSHGPCACLGSGPKPLIREGITFVPLIFATDSLKLAASWDADTQTVFLLHPASGRVLRLAAAEELTALPEVKPLSVGVDADAEQPWDALSFIAALTKYPPLMHATTINDENLLHLAARTNSLEVMTYLLEHGVDVNSATKTGFTPLFWAANSGSLDAIKLLVAHGATLETKNEDRGSPLYTAVSRGHFAVAEYLIQLGAGPNTATRYGTALHNAALEGNLRMITFLLDHGADVNAQSEGFGQPPIHQAILRGYVDVVKLLIDRGANISTLADHFGKTALHYAAEHGEPKIAALLLERGADDNLKDKDGETALHLAVREKWADTPFLSDTINPETLRRRAEKHAAYLDTERVLLAHGADVTMMNREDGESPFDLAVGVGYTDVVMLMIERNPELITNGGNALLFTAVESGNTQLIRMLVEHGLDVNVQDEDGTTPLHTASFSSEADVARVLLELGADPNTHDYMGETPLHDAFEMGGDKTAAFSLMEFGARVDVRDDDGQTPLHDVATWGDWDETTGGSEEETLAMQPDIEKEIQLREQAVLQMIARGAPVNAKDHAGQTALHKAAGSGLAGVAQILLQQGAPVNARDEEGLTPLHLAAREGNPKTVAVLLAAKADVQARDNEGRTPLQYAEEEPFPEVIKLLKAAGAR